MTTGGAGPTAPAGYPGHLVADVVARDGATVHLRPIRPDDAPRIVALHARLSAETIYFRFFNALATLSPAMLERFVVVDYRDRLALVAVLGDDIVAVGRYERLPSGGGDEAEVAFLVDDAHQGRGLGSVLLEHLAGAARKAGIARFVADTLPDNARMLRVFHDAGFADERHFADGVVRVAFPIGATDTAASVAHERERQAASRSVRRLLAPRSVAVIGASRHRGRLGHEMVRRLIEGGFNGPVLPVNPSARHVAGIRAYPSVLDVPDRVDLAVVVVPTAAVAEVVDQCARKHVGALVVVSSGFAEADADGLLAERRLVGAARGNGMRLVGPAAMGIVNTDPAVSLNATFSPMPPAGRVGFVAQSGGLGVVLLDELARRGLGVSSFVSAGNKADVSGNDLLQYWDEDPGTDVALMYIESFGNPRTFARVARRVSRHKPIVAVKSGRSGAGSVAAGQDLATRQDDAAVDALFRQAGVIRTDTLEELFDVAQVLAAQPLPAGRRVAIVAHSGGPGVLAADACSSAGLRVAELSAATQEHLAAALPFRTRVRNPVDLAPDAPPEAFEVALSAVLLDGAVDAAIVLYTSPLPAAVERVAVAVDAGIASAPGKPVVACVLGHRGLLPGGAGRHPIPSFAFPEAAAHALGRVASYAEWRRRPTGSVVEPDDVDTAGGRRVIDDAVAAGAVPGSPAVGDWMDPGRVAELLGCYGIHVADRSAPDDWGLGAGVTQDALFGPLVTLWTGSRAVPARRTTAARSLPVTDLDADELCDTVLGDTVLGDTVLGDTLLGDTVLGDTAAGRGEPVAAAGHWARLPDLLARLGRLADDAPELAELDVYPIELDDRGELVVGARARLGPFAPRPDLALRRLR